MAASGMWNCPALTFWTRSEVPGALTSPDIEYVSLALRRNFVEPAPVTVRPDNTRRMVKLLHDAGARLQVGTWTGSVFVLPGFSVREELREFVKAGLSPTRPLRPPRSMPRCILTMQIWQY